MNPCEQRVDNSFGQSMLTELPTVEIRETFDDSASDAFRSPKLKR